MKATNPTTQAQHRYNLQLTLAMVAYIVLLFGTRLAFRGVTGPLAVAVDLVPAVPMVFVLLAIVRWLQGTDEFNRRIIVDSLAIAGGTTAFMSLTYGFVEGDLLPRPSAFWTWSVFMFLWAISAFILRRRYV